MRTRFQQGLDDLRQRLLRMGGLAEQAVDRARQAYVDRNPKSFARQQEAIEAMPGGNTRTTLHNAPFPLTVVKGEGCRLWDADGHEYIDVLGEYTAGIYGHSHPVIRAAIDKALPADRAMASQSAQKTANG